MTWEECQEWERQWHGDCVATEFGERFKQLAYAKRMGLRTYHDGKSPFNIDMEGKRCVELGGGPYSMLLFCRNVQAMVIDPCRYPSWVYDRYDWAGIKWRRIPAEEFDETGYDEAIVANCLQHVIDPALVIANARRAATIVRVFEWIDTGTSDGHNHNLSEEKLNEWLGGEGKVEQINENFALGKAYFGIFKGL